MGFIGEKGHVQCVGSFAIRCIIMSGFSYGLFFHKNRKPRGWVRRILFRRNNVPREIFTRLVFKKNGNVRPHFTAWAKGTLAQEAGQAAAAHKYVQLAIAESSLFDPAWYLEKYPDVAAAGVEPLEHYIANGAAELREPGPRFDAAWYANQHATDPRAAQNPLFHYIENGGSRDGFLGPARRMPRSRSRYYLAS